MVCNLFHGAICMAVIRMIAVLPVRRQCSGPVSLHKVPAGDTTSLYHEWKAEALSSGNML